MTHDEYQQQIVDLARLYGWRHLHVRKAVGRRGGKAGWQTPTNVKGWPDLFLWNPKRGGVLAVEVKVGRDKPSPEQVDVLASLDAAGIPTVVAYPDDFDRVHALLRPDPNEG